MTSLKSGRSSNRVSATVEPSACEAAIPSTQSRLIARLLGSPRNVRLFSILIILDVVLAAVIVFGGRIIAEELQGMARVPLPAMGIAPAISPPKFLFSIAGVSRPLGVAVAPNGDRIYVTESAGERETKVFDRNGRLLGTLNPPDSAPASRVPVYVAVSPQGEVYVSDRRAAAVQAYSPEGSYLGVVAPPGGEDGKWEPLALGFDAGGNLLVTNVSPGKHSVIRYSPQGTLLSQFGREGSGDGEFSYPNGIAGARDGSIVVADSNNGRVIAFNSEGKVLWTLGRGGVAIPLALPRGLAVDDKDRLYVVDTISHNIAVLQLGESAPRVLFTLGSQGLKDGQFVFPNGLAIDGSNRIYITDRENDRVQVWSY